ncbi:hypothetical protein V1511DRAFT_485965 [Dipodascopsis uninucleata]
MSEADLLPPGWSRHVAPTGHYYYYNKNTKESTYERPKLQGNVPDSKLPTGPRAFRNDRQTRGGRRSAYGGKHKNDHRLASQEQQWMNAYSSNHQQYDPGHHRHNHQGSGFHHRPRKKEITRLMRPLPIAPWFIVVTNHGRPFVYNQETKESKWLPPPNVQVALDEMDREELILMIARCRGLKTGRSGTRLLVKRQPGGASANESSVLSVHESTGTHTQNTQDEEEIDESEFMMPPDSDDDSVPHPIIRQRNRSVSDNDDDDDDDDEEEEEEEEEENQSSEEDEDDSEEEVDSDLEAAIEFNEDDIEYQINALLAEDPNLQAEAEVEEEEIPYAERVKSFKEMLFDLNVNPYSPWETEMHKLVDDPRYILFHTMADRRVLFDEWSRDRIAELKALKQNEPKLDPKEQFLEFLRSYATPKLFYLEFKRKYRKDPSFRDSPLTDREKEKLYRQYIEEG